MSNLKLYIFLTLFILWINMSYSQTWVQQNSGTSSAINDISFINSNTGFAACSGGLILKTTTSGANWFQINTGYNFNIIRIKFFDNNLGVAGGDKIIKTTNGGTNWILLYDTAYANDIQYLNQNEWWVSSNQPHRNIKTTNQGAAWSSIGNSDFIQPSIYFLNENTGWISGKFVTGSFIPSHVSKSTNGGLNWTMQYSQVSFQNNAWIYDILFLNQNKGFALYWDYTLTKIVMTTNGGTNWIETPTPNRKQKNIFFISDNIGWTCGDSGFIFKTMNGGNNWVIEQISSNFYLNAITFVTNETGWTCGANGVILKTTNGGISAIQQTSTEIPVKYSLSQNYPNPFNPSTQINFDIPKFSFVNLIVYDALGREIEQLVNEELNPGTYVYDWNASSYPSGIYFYKIMAGDPSTGSGRGFTETKKMVLIK